MPIQIEREAIPALEDKKESGHLHLRLNQKKVLQNQKSLAKDFRFQKTIYIKMSLYQSPDKSQRKEKPKPRLKRIHRMCNQVFK